MRAILLIVLSLAAADAFAHSTTASDKGWARIEANEPAPRFVLTNQDARRVALEDLRGKPLALTFLYTHCTDVCPVLLHVLASAEQHLPAGVRGAVRFVGITVDPSRDTPERLRDYLKARGLDGARWHLLTGSIAEATKVANDYGVVVRPAPRGDFVHNSVFVVIDAQGRGRAEFHGMATPPRVIAQELEKLVKERRN